MIYLDLSFILNVCIGFILGFVFSRVLCGVVSFVFRRTVFFIANRIYGWTEWRWLIPMLRL